MSVPLPIRRLARYIFLAAVFCLSAIASFGQTFGYTNGTLDVTLQTFHPCGGGVPNGYMTWTVNATDGAPATLFYQVTPGGGFAVQVIAPGGSFTHNLAHTLTVGTYNFIIQDNTSNINTFAGFPPAVLTSLPAITLSQDALSNNTSCLTPDGQIQSTISGGSLTLGAPAPNQTSPQASFTYTWTSDNSQDPSLPKNIQTDGTTPIVLNGLAGGTYTLLVEDDYSDCSQTRVFVITDPSPDNSLVVGTTTPSVCAGEQGIITLSDSESSPPAPAPGVVYEIFKDGVATGITQNGTGASLAFIIPPAELSPAGATYNFTIQGSNGFCTPVFMTGSANITVNPQPVLTPSGDILLSCAGDTDGAGTFTASGGTPGYTFTVDSNTTGGTTSTTATTLDFTGAGVGAITVTVTDASGCSQQATITITEPAVLTLTTTGDIVLGCNGDTDGAGTFTAGGGTPGYTFNIDSNTTGGTTSTTATTLDFAGAGIGVIIVTVTDANGCSTQASINITQPPVLTLVNSGDIALACGGDTNGAGTFTAAGGTAPYNFTVDSNTTGGTTSTTAATLDFINAGAGAITVTVTDANGCTAQSTLTITEPPVLTLSTTGDILLNCNGDTNGAGTFTAGGGTPGYTFTVDVNTTGAATSTTATTLDFTGAGIGVITITVTDANGCSQQATINVTQPPAITLNTTGDILLGCNGDTDGAGTFTAGGGTPGYTFTVDTNTTGATTSTTATTLDFAGAGIGVITITVNDANGCSTQSTITVTQPPVLVLNPSADVALLCNGDTNGAGTFAASGGTAPYTFTVDANTTGGATGTTATTLDFSGAGAGAVTVTVTDANGCSQQATITVTEPTVLTLVTTGDILLGCNGDTDGAGTFTAGGGTPGYTFTIDTNTTGAATSTTATTLDFTGAGVGVITVTVTDANGCSQQATINVTQPPVLTLVNSGDIALSCGGDTTGGGTFAAAGGTAPYIFTVDANTTGGTTSTTATTLDFANAGAGVITVTVTDASGCTAQSTLTITEPPALTLVTTGDILLGCNGDTNGAGTFTAAGGTPGYTFTVDANTTGATTSTTATTLDFTGAGIGAITITVTDANGCTQQATINVTEPPAITLATTGDILLSCNGDTNGAGTFAAAGGTPGYTFTVDANTTGATTTTTATTLDFTGAGAGLITVTVTDASGCSTQATINVNEPTALVLTPSVDFALLCNGDTDGTGTFTASGGTAPYIFTVDANTTGGTTSTTATTLDFAGAAVGSITVTVTDASGCTQQATINVTEPSALTLNTTGDIVLTCNGDTNGAGSFTAGGGTPGYTFVVDTNTTGATTSTTATTLDFTGASIGAITVTVTDANGCSTQSTINVTEPPLPTAADAGPDKTVCGPTNLEGNTPLVGTGTWTIIAGAGGTLANANSPTSGFSGTAGVTYTLRWSIANGPCTPSTDDVDITFDINTPTTADAGPDQDLCAASTVLAGNTPVIGVGTWSIVSGAGGTILDPADPVSAFNGVQGTTYVLQWTIDSGGGCATSIDQVTIVLGADPTIADAGADQTVCTPSTNLAGNLPVVGTGLWSIVSGVGGVITDAADPASAFSGTAGTTYVLRWTISSGSCTPSEDDVQITFEVAPTTANAGPDQLNICGAATLAANTPLVGTGAWTIVSGAGGVLVDPTDPATSFSGTAGTTYTLRWTITNGSCPPSIDEVDISFDSNTPTASNAGPDQQICGTSTVLGANNPVVGTGSWSIVSGAGGSVGNTFDPNSNFGGTAGETYLLRWVITSVCGSSADTVMIVFDENPTIADAGADASICGPVVLSANVPTVGTGQWTIITGAGGLLADPNDPNSLFSGVGGTTYTLRWTITNGTCPASTDEVDVAFDVNTPTTADAGPDQAVCATFTTLAANTAVVGIGQWTILSGVGGSFVDDTNPTTDFNGAAGETYVLRWEISNGALCTPSNDDVTIVFDIAPSVADAGSDQTQCTTTVTLAGNTPVSGTGTWSVISGLGGSFVDPADPATDFTGTSGVTYVLQWAISNACGSSTDDVTISFDALPTTADAGPDKNVCGPTTLDGNTPVVGTGTWTIIAGAGGVLADPNDPTSTFSGVGGTTYTLRWTIDNGSCPSSFDEVDISFDINTPTTADAGPDQSICATTATLAANTPVVGTGLWTIVSGAGGSFVDPTNPTTDFSGTAGTIYQLQWTISNGGSCAPSIDQVTIAFEVAPTVAAAGSDQALCGTNATLAANVPTSGTGQWTISSGAGGSFADDLDPASAFTGVNGSTYVLRWTIANSCGSTFDEVSIQFLPDPSVANAGPDQIICGSTLTNLAANTPAIGTGTWTIVNGAGGAVVTPSSPTSQFVGSAGVAYTLRWIITNGSCTPSTDDVVINFAASPTVTSPVNACVNSAAPSLTASATGATAIHWFTDAALTNEVFVGSLYTPAASELNMTVVGTTTFFVTAEYGCGMSTSSQVTVNVVNTPGCSGGVNCSVFTVNINDTRPSCSDRDDGIMEFSISGGSGNYVVTLYDSLTTPGTPFTKALPGTSGAPITFIDLSPSLNYFYRINDGTNICTLPFSLPVQTTVNATADPASFVDAVCFGDPTGSAIINASGSQTGDYFYSVDNGVTWTIFTPGNPITNLPPNGTYNILVGESINDACRTSVSVTINSANPQINAAFAITPATCNTNDGAILVNAAGGSGSGYEFSIDGGNSFQTSNQFSTLAGGAYTLRVRDGIGCFRDFTVNVTFPGFVNHTIVPADADCSNQGNSGSITVTIPDPGVYQVALSTDQFNEPPNDQYQNYNNPSVTFSDLARGTYFIYIKSTGATCPTRSAPISILGVQALSFEILPVCTADELSISLTNLTGEPGSPFEIQVYRKLTNVLVQSINFSSIPITGSVELNYNDYVFLQTPGDYQILMTQINSTAFCLVQSELVDFTVAADLFAEVISTQQSLPDINTGSMVISNFNGGLPGYFTFVELASPAVPGQSFESGPDVVQQNLNNDYEIEYDHIPAGQYEVIVTDQNGCSITLTAVVPLDTRIIVPNVFTPNGDGVNDSFFIRNLPADSKLIISNRWGKEVFSSNSYQNNWTGEGLLDGVYFYRLKSADGDPITGWVEIIRGVKP